jgi:hypothetical protein
VLQPDHGEGARSRRLLLDSFWSVRCPSACSLLSWPGLSLVRAGRQTDALPELEAAARLAPDEARDMYV